MRCLKEEIISLKRKIKQIKIGKNRIFDGLGECSLLRTEEEGGTMCISSVLGELASEMNNLKNEVIKNF